MAHVTSGLVRVVSAVVLSIADFYLIYAFPVQTFELPCACHVDMCTVLTSGFVRMVRAIVLTVADEIFINTAAIFTLELSWARAVLHRAVAFV